MDTKSDRGGEVRVETVFRGDMMVRRGVLLLVMCVVAGLGCAGEPVAADPPSYDGPEGIVSLTGDSFDSLVCVPLRVAMVDFFHPTCLDCKSMNGIVDQIAATYRGKALIAKVDVARQDSLSRSFNITAVPAFVFFKGGVEKKRIVDVVRLESLTSVLDELLGTTAPSPSLRSVP